MNVLILGGDGYLGWATAMRMSSQGYSVTVIDNYLRRHVSHELNAEPLIDVPNLGIRTSLWEEGTGQKISVRIGDICDYAFLLSVFREAEPDVVIHYAEQPSAPYSMIDQNHAAFTVHNNLMSTLNVAFAVRETSLKCHIVKLGTMGEYGTPNIDIEEGYLDVVHKGRKERFIYPKKPGSIYHLTKVQDSDFLYFTTRIWGLSITDLNQGPVYGIDTKELEVNERLAPIFNYDDVLGTVLNRFLVQAVVGFPLTVYGKGGQTRGYLNIKDTLQCVSLAIKNPPGPGEFRVFNQFTETFTVNELAEQVAKVGNAIGLGVTINHIDNPRMEEEEHYYNPIHTGLAELGLEPHLLTDESISSMLDYVRCFKSNIRKEYILPRVKWA